MKSVPTIAVLTHVPYEGPAYIAEHCHLRGVRVVEYALYRQVEPPPPDECDALVVMGGPMSVSDGHRYPWLQKEIACIERHLARGTPVLGICLGAQLVAAALGAQVYPNRQKEIGFWPVEFLRPAIAGRNPVHGHDHDSISKLRYTSYGEVWDRAFGAFPARTTVFHWHGDTFDLPRGATHRARSAACQNQMFTFGDSVLAIQFHIEATTSSVLSLARACGKEVGNGFYEAPERGARFEARMLRDAERACGAANALMRELLDTWLQEICV